MASSARGAKHQHVLQMYRRLLGLARRLPESKQDEALFQIRQGFREHAEEADEAR